MIGSERKFFTDRPKDKAKIGPGPGAYD